MTSRSEPPPPSDPWLGATVWDELPWVTEAVAKLRAAKPDSTPPRRSGTEPWMTARDKHETLGMTGVDEIDDDRAVFYGEFGPRSEFEECFEIGFDVGVEHGFDIGLTADSDSRDSSQLPPVFFDDSDEVESYYRDAGELGYGTGWLLGHSTAQALMPPASRG